MKPQASLEFPTRRDAVRGAWQPLYLEPMVGSGERICVGVLAASENEYCIIPVLGVERLSCLYGKSGLEFIQIILDETFRSVESDLSSKEIRQRLTNPEVNTDVLEFPFEGIFTGRIRQSTGNTIQEIARHGLLMCASLTEKAVDTSDQTDESMTRTRVESGVKNLVTALEPRLSGYFKIPRKIDNQSRSVNFGFIGQHLAANFAYLSPLSLQQTLDHTKSKLWDLSLLKEYYGVSSAYSEQREHYKVFIYTPDKEDVSYLPRHHREIASALHALELESAHRQVKIFPHNSLQVMAAHLVGLETGTIQEAA